MADLTSNKTFLTSVVIIGFALAFAGLSVYSVMAGVIALIALYRLLRCIEGERNWTAIQGALADYEAIIGGALWVGKDAEVLASDRVDDPTKPGPICCEQICRTKNGAWFIFYVTVTHSRVIARDLRPCDEATARRRLQRHKEVYVRCFGQPTAA